MEFYLALDGGGTKLQGILFDSTYHLIAAARSGGINPNVHSREAAIRHIDECIGSMFAQAKEKGIEIPSIRRVLSSWGGIQKDVIIRHCPAEEYVVCGEGPVGILCCGLTSGLLALSGTGSDIFLVRGCERIDAIGGWGYVLGDDGSGVWIGRKAVRSMLRVLEKISPEDSIIHSLIREQYHPCTPSDLVEHILRSPSPGREIGSFCKIVNMAAEQGDSTACGILQEAGHVLAEDVMRMKAKHSLPDSFDICMAGSVFQYCTEMSRTFTGHLAESWPGAQVHKAIFQPVIGCVIYEMMQNGRPLDAETIAFLKKEYAAFCA